MALFGVIAFVAFCGALLLLLMLGIGGGLGVAARERKLCRAIAARLGCRYAGMGRYEGQVDSVTWRAAVHEDQDSGRCWADFQAGSPRIGRDAVALAPDWHQGLGVAAERVSASCKDHWLQLQVEGLREAHGAEMERLLQAGIRLLGDVVRDRPGAGS